jgi:hypothetical protein
MTIEELLQRQAAFHTKQAEEDKKISKSHAAIAEAQTDAVLGQHFRDLSDAHGRGMKNHTDHARHLLTVREELSAASDAELFDSRGEAGYALRTAAGHDGLLKVMGLRED